MALHYSYVKERYLFNRPFNFFLRNEVLANYPPNKKERKNFILRDMTDRTTEKITQFAIAEVNTDNAEYVSNGMSHTEGGWPKDVDISDEEQMLRYTKKLQRSEEYRVQMSRNLDSMKSAVMQNAGVNIYENYFDKFDSANVLKCFSYPDAESKTSASKISFSTEENPKLAVAYSESIYILNENNVTYPLVWDINNNENPVMKLKSIASCSTLEYNMNTKSLAGGFQNGQICVWDVRKASDPDTITDIESSHLGCVNSVRWSDKKNYEIVSGSSNGQVFWWDIRNIKSPLCNFKINSNTQAYENEGESGTDVACTVLAFDKITPEQILIGTGDGRIIFADRSKSQNTNEMRNACEMICHYGPVSTIEQNWASDKSILTIDSCDIKMWPPNCKTEPIFSKGSVENEFSCGVWSSTRYSRFFVGKVNGTIEFWDLAYHHNEPYFSFKPAYGSVKDVQTHCHGKLMACCYDNGDVYTIQLSDKLLGPIKNVLCCEEEIESNHEEEATVLNHDEEESVSLHEEEETVLNDDVEESVSLHEEEKAQEEMELEN